VLDFMKMDALMSETVDIKDELKREVERVIEARARGAVKARPGKRAG
jgi:NTE family protein